MSRNTGWHRQYERDRRPAPIVWQPSAWDELLSRLSLPESAVPTEIQGRTNHGKTLRKWIKSHYTRRYVPETVLELCGLKEWFQ